MILQALCDYYERRRDGDANSLPPQGFELKSIPFVIVLKPDGTFVNLEDTRSESGPSKRGRVFMVPQTKKRSGMHSWKTACLLWDNIGYALGVPPPGKTAEQASLQHRSFVERLVEAFGDSPSDEGVGAVLVFLQRGDYAGLTSHPCWEELRTTAGANVTFRLAGEPVIVPERPAVHVAVTGLQVPGTGGAQCLVTGETRPVATLHPAIKGVRGTQTSGANIVSFNLDAFRTHGRAQGANAPVSEAAAFAYTTALNALLVPGGRQKAHAGDTTVVFWAQRDNPVEDLVGALFHDEREVLDDPDRGVERLRAVYTSAWQGHPPLRDDCSRFFVLGLAPNAARIAVRFWRVSTVAEFAARVLQHFADVAVVRPPWAGRHPTVRSLLRSVAPLGKDKNIPPILAGAMFDAIVSGKPYPHTLLQAAVRRARAEQGTEHGPVTADRAALLRGCLVRRARAGGRGELEVQVSLDESNENAGYRLGRLFALLERAQEIASPGVAAGLRSRYYAGASATPVAVFSTLMRLKNHHLAKIDNRGAVVNLERAIGSVMGGLTEFPPTLSLADQGRFALGYYHQRQSFFEKKTTTEETSDA